MTETFDTVIIGSGMGAMTAARLLQDKRGDRIVMLEAHDVLGGMTHEFHRSGDGHRWSFASGLHYLGKTEAGFGTAGTMRYLTGDRIQWHDLPDRYDIFDWGDGQIGLPSGHDRLQAQLSERFPDEEKAISRYFSKMIPSAMRGLTAINIANSLPKPARAIALPIASWIFRLALTPTAKVLATQVTSPDLRAILAFQWGDYGRSPQYTAFGFHALIAHHYAEGAAFPIGGPSRISDKTLDLIRRAGADIRAGHRVTEILLEDGKVSGVRVHNRSTGEHYTLKASKVISAIGARQTAELLPDPMGTDLQSELSTLGRNISACVLFLGLKDDPAALGFDGANHWIFDSIEDVLEDASPAGEGPLYVSFGSMKDPAARSHGIEIVTLTEPSGFDQWAGMEAVHSDPGYLAEKKRITKRILERMEARHPGFTAMIAHHELATPLTFGTYQRAADGAFYGLPASPQRMKHRLASPRWPVSGLVLAGQDAMSPGILGAAAGGIRAVGVMLGGDKTPELMAHMRAEAEKPWRKGEPWNGFLKVSRIIDESPTVKSFHLTMPDGAPLPLEWTPGQFLTLHAPTLPKTTLRSYSISSAHRDGGTDLRLTIKAEPGGRVSPWMHTNLRVGDYIEIAGPFGDFTFAPGDADHIVLIGGGVGVTPFAAILDDLARRKAATRVTAIFGYRSEDEILFAQDMPNWTRAMKGLSTHIVVSEAPETWTGETGVINEALLKRLVPDIANTRVHVCGPQAMMASMAAILPKLGVLEEAIRTETFSSAQAPSSNPIGASITVTFAQQNRIARGKVGQTLLDIAQEAGIDIPVVCGAGSCGACRMRLIEGDIVHPKSGPLTPEERGQGFILACQTRLQSDMIVDG